MISKALFQRPLKSIERLPLTSVEFGSSPKGYTVTVLALPYYLAQPGVDSEAGCKKSRGCLSDSPHAKQKGKEGREVGHAMAPKSYLPAKIPEPGLSRE